MMKGRKDEGEKAMQSARQGEWIWLEEEGWIYEVTEGEAEIYAVDGRASSGSSRHFLGTAAVGSCFASPPAGSGGKLRLLAIATSPLKLVCRTWESSPFAAAEEEPGRAAERWASLLSVTFCRPKRALLPRLFHVPAYGKPEMLKKGTWIMPPQHDAIAWLSVSVEGLAAEQQGRLIEGYGVVLLHAKAPVRLGADAEVVLQRTTDVLQQAGPLLLHAAYGLEYRRFSEAYEAFFAAQERSQKKQLQESAAQRERILDNSCRELLSGLLPKIPFVHRAEAGEQPAVVHAVREIAAFYGVERNRVRLPVEAPNLSNMREVLHLIALSSGLHGRRVELAGNWYEKDLGPLLVRRGSEPLAALPVNPKRYEYVDIEHGKRVEITPEVADGLQGEAYCFYPMIPEGSDTPGAWLRWTMRFCWRKDFWTILFCCLFAGFIPVVTPLVTQTVFSDIIPSFDKQAHLVVVQVMLVTSVAGALLQLMRGLTVMRFKNHMRVPAEAALWLKLLSLPAAFFRRFQVGDLAQRMQGLQQISAQFSTAAAAGVFNGIFCFWNLLVMFYYSHKMALLAVLVWLCFSLLSLLFSYQQVKNARRKAEASGRVSGLVLQLLAGLNKFKLRAAEERAFYLWTRRFGEAWRWNRDTRRQGNHMEILSQGQTLVLNFVIFYFAMTMFDQEKELGRFFLDEADFLSFYAAMGGFGASLTGLFRGGVSLWRVMPMLERVRPILKEKSEATEDRMPAGELSGEISVDSLAFRYRSDAPWVLRDVSFAVKPGTFLAIVGSSGSGKSTLLRLLLGMEQPQKGSVAYDGLALRDLDVASVRRQIGVVMQNGQLLPGTIFSNIVGSLPLTIDDAWEAARLVGLAQDIKEMPMGMHTIVNDGGTVFSGGQRQRLLIARSLVQRPRIVVFDEATSSLDNETQAIVTETLAAMKATRILVAHRLSTIRHADRILVLENGVIAEEGSYEELMAMKGLFFQLAERQQL